MSDVPGSKEQAPEKILTERNALGGYQVPNGERIASLSADGKHVDIWWRNDGGVTHLQTLPLQNIPSAVEPPQEPR